MWIAVVRKEIRFAAVVAAVLTMGLAALVSGGAAASAQDRTIAVADTGDALVNGESLLATVQQARSFNPSAADRVTISLAAGVFDIGGVTTRLPDGVDIVGAGASETHLCDCARVEAGLVQRSRQWFQVRGANRFAQLTFRDGGEFVVTNYSDVEADVVFESVEVVLEEHAHIPQPGAGEGVSYASPSTLVDLQTGSVTFANSAVVYPTGSARRPGSYVGPAFLQTDNGGVRVIDSIAKVDLVDRQTPGPIEIVRSVVGDIAAGRTNEFTAEDSEFGGLSVGGAGSGRSISLARNTIRGPLSVKSWSPFSVVDTDVITSLTSEFGGQGEIIGGSFVNPVSADADSRPAVVEALSVRNGIVFDSVVMVNHRFVSDDNVQCTNTTNNDVVFGIDGAPDEIIATHTPPLNCGENRDQPYPGGNVPTVPGWIEGENYDTVAFGLRGYYEPAYDPPVAGDDAYRADDVRGLIRAIPDDGGHVVEFAWSTDLNYTFDAPVAGLYNIRLRTTRQTTFTRYVRASLDGMEIGEYALAESNAWEFTHTGAIRVYLEAGRHQLVLDPATRADLDRIEITKNVIDIEPPSGLECTVDGEQISWTGYDGVTYVWRSIDDGATWKFLRNERYLSSTRDGPHPDAQYRIRGLLFAPVDCVRAGEPEPEPEPQPQPQPQPQPTFACSVDGTTISWTDAGAEKYWVYRSADNGLTWQWVAGTTGTTATDRNQPPGATYQAHHADIARVDCSISDEPEPPDPTPTPTPTPGLISLPAVIDAENYTRAIDTEPGNQGAATQFSGDVDVWPKPNGDGYVVGRVRPSESISYVVTVADAGSYSFSIRTSSGGSGSDVTVRLDGVKVGAKTSLTGTGGWWTFADTTIGSTNLTTGRHVITVQWGAGQSNFESLSVTAD